MIIGTNQDRPLIRYDTAKPLLRGWLHAAAALAALLVTVALVQRTGADQARMLAVLLFGLSMVVLYVVSATLHLGRWDERTHALLCRLDYANIFIKIAGSFTPFAALATSGWLQTALLASVWLGALLGICAISWSERFPPWVLVAQYIFLGGLATSVLPLIAFAYSIWPVVALVLGGGAYIAGAAVFVRQRPEPWPGVFGFHELFHLCGLCGNATTVAVVWWMLAR